MRVVSGWIFPSGKSNGRAGRERPGVRLGGIFRILPAYRTKTWSDRGGRLVGTRGGTRIFYAPGKILRLRPVIDQERNTAFYDFVQLRLLRFYACHPPPPSSSAFSRHRTFFAVKPTKGPSPKSSRELECRRRRQYRTITVTTITIIKTIITVVAIV